MRKEKSLNSAPIVLPYGEVNVTMLPCHPSHEKIDSPPAGEPVRYTCSFEEVVSLLEMSQLSFRRPCSHDVSVVWIHAACMTVVMGPQSSAIACRDLRAALLAFSKPAALGRLMALPHGGIFRKAARRRVAGRVGEVFTMANHPPPAFIA